MAERAISVFQFISRLHVLISAAISDLIMGELNVAAMGDFRFMKKARQLESWRARRKPCV
jgi:hypothetical protein